MSFVQRELDRIGRALRGPLEGNQYDRLYAAQQALSWATDPAMFRPPYASVFPETTGTLGDSVDCSARPRPPRS